MLGYTDYVKIFVGFLVIVNPFGSMPIFLDLTAGMSERERNSITNMVAVTVCSILLVSLVFGEIILQFFGISIHSFRVGGGILLLLMAVSMMHARVSPIVQTQEEVREAKDKNSVAVVPLSIPLLAGPGAISAVTIAADRGTGTAHYAIVAAEILVLTAFVWIVFRLSPRIARRLSAPGLNVLMRIEGLILSAIAVEFIALGLRGLFPGLA
ncbi:MAG TPA: NAAT family transporter [Gammaproteobacteria bacterium]|nr:NAAT family transporter [Gammaproteobacteria bacterium]